MSVDAAGTLHEDYTVQITVEGQHLGQVVYDSGRADLHWKRTGFALFCPYCGRVWARLSAKNSKGEQLTYTVWEVGCAKHPDTWNIPGSVLAYHLINLLDQMPEAVVRREFELLLEQAQGENVCQIKSSLWSVPGAER